MQKLLRTRVVIATAAKLARIGLILSMASVLILAVSAIPAMAQLSTFTALLNSGQEPALNPDITANAFGVAFMTFDGTTGEFCFRITYTDDKLTSSETAAHFHFPARPGENAGVRIPLPAGSPKNGCVTPELTDGDIADLFAGLWYVNIHTEVNPGGEIRGQVNTTFISY